MFETDGIGQTPSSLERYLVWSHAPSPPFHHLKITWQLKASITIHWHNAAASLALARTSSLPFLTQHALTFNPGATEELRHEQWLVLWKRNSKNDNPKTKRMNYFKIWIFEICLATLLRITFQAKNPLFYAFPTPVPIVGKSQKCGNSNVTSS